MVNSLKIKLLIAVIYLRDFIQNCIHFNQILISQICEFCKIFP